MAIFSFDNSFARQLPAFHVAWKPAAVPAPRLLFLNRPLAEELGLDAAALAGADGAALFAGNLLPEGAEPVAQAYAGHREKLLHGGKARLVRLQIVAHLAVGFDNPANGLRRHVSALVNRRRRDQALDFKVVRVGEITHERHGVVGLILNIGEDKNARFGCASQQGQAADEEEQTGAA